MNIYYDINSKCNSFVFKLKQQITIQYSLFNKNLTCSLPVPKTMESQKIVPRRKNLKIQFP